MTFTTTAYGIKLGYVPREDNKIAARLMDAGKFFRQNSDERKEGFLD